MARGDGRSLCCHWPKRRRWDLSRDSPGLKPKATPLPKLKLLAAVSAVFTTDVGSALVFPFLVFMVHDFFPELSPEQIGKKAGVLGSAYFIGNFVGSFFWGWVSDVWGRRPVLLLGICGQTCSDILFGFSQNYTWAIMARFMRGLLEGNLSVAKSYISEVCDDSNQARGFAVVGASAAIARIFGAVIGGFLSQPSSKYSFLQTPLFCRFPYLLPCLVLAASDILALISKLNLFPGPTELVEQFSNIIVISVLSLLSSLANYLFLKEDVQRRERTEETNDHQTPNSHSDIELLGQDKVGERTEREGEGGERSEDEEEDIEGGYDSQVPLIVESDIDSQSDQEVVASDTELLVNETERRGPRKWKYKGLGFRNPRGYFYDTRAKAVRCCACCTSCVVSCRSHQWKEELTKEKVREFVWKKLKMARSKLIMILRLIIDFRILLTTSLYGALGFLTLISQELFPLLMVNDTKHGGYNLDNNEIGLIYGIAAVIELIYQFALYPRVAKLLGYRRLFQVAMVIFAIAVALLPLANKITGPIPIPGGDVNGTDGNYSVNGSELIGSGWEYLNSSDNATDYCGNDLSDSIKVNENSIKRIPILIWVVLVTIITIQILSRINAFISIVVMISNSSLPTTRGLVNGIGQTYVAIGRALGPFVGGWLFAWSESTGRGWPINYHFVFDVLAVGSVLAILISLLIPKNIEMKRQD